MNMNSNSQYKFHWMDLSHISDSFEESVGIGSLLGVNHRFIRRDLGTDLAVLKQHNISHAIILCEQKELERFGVPNLFNKMEEIGIETYHYPSEYGLHPSIKDILEIIHTVVTILENNEKCIIISRDGFGRSGVVGGCIILHTNDYILCPYIYESIKVILGPRAIQTVKQYNFLMEFRTLRDEFNSAVQNIYLPKNNFRERRLSR